MAQPTMAVRIAANLSELKKNLAEGKDQIEAVRAGFQRLTTSFSGDKLIQHAHNVAAAVQEIGGASKLTEAEQARVNAVVEKALAKYQALGREAPAALQQLADDTRKVNAASTNWAGNLNSYVTGAVAGISAAVSNFAINVLGQAIRGLGDFIIRGGQVASMRGSFDALSGGVEQARDRIDAIRSTTRGLVDEMSIMQASNKATLLGLGLNNEQMGELAKTAVILGRAMGQDATKSLDDLITALGRSSPMILDNLGLSVKLGEANEAYARALGKTAEQLTDAEKKQAFMNAAMEAAREKVHALGEVNLTAADRVTQLWTSVTNIADAFAGWLVKLTPVNAALDALVWRMAALEGLFRGGPKEALKAYEQAMAESRGEAEKLTEQTKAVTTASMSMAVSHKASTEAETVLTQAAVAHTEARRTQAVVLQTLVAPAVQQSNDLEARTLQETGRLTQALERWAQVNGATLAPSIRQVNAALSEQAPLVARANTQWATFAPTVQQQSADAAMASNGFMTQLRGLFGGDGDMGRMLQTIGPQFAAAFMGPGSAADKMKAFATAGMGALLGMIPGVGPWLQAFSGPIVEGLTKLASKAKSLLSSIFGGPSAGEQEARRMVAEFEDSLRDMLTEQQRLEAGGERWKEVVIAVTAAYAKVGLSADEAARDVEILWKSSKQGAGATEAAMAAIEAKMKGMGASAAEAAAEVTDAFNRVPRDIKVRVRAEVEGEGYESYKVGSRGIRDFGSGTPAVLHGRERVQTEAQMHAERDFLLSLPRPSTAPSVTVQVDARGALVGDYESQQRLADLVSDAVMGRLGLQQRLGFAGVS